MYCMYSMSMYCTCVCVYVCVFSRLAGGEICEGKKFQCGPFAWPFLLQTPSFKYLVSLLAREMGIPPLEILRRSKVVKNTLSSLSLKS